MPIRLESEQNRRDHWAVKARRVKQHRLAALAVPKHPLPCVVTITRVAPRELDSHDNLRSAAKGLVDGIAARLGVDDRDERVRWEYAQARGRSKEYAVRVKIEPLP